MRHVLWSVPANADLEAIDDYHSAYSGAAADRIANKLERGGAFLATTPFAGPAIADIPARKWHIATTRYVLIYRVLDDAIQVLRIFNDSQDWAAELREEQ